MATGPAVAARDIAGIAGRNLRRLVRTPQLLIFTAIQPAMLLLLFRYAIGGAIASSQNNGYYPGRPVYRETQPVYVEPRPVYVEPRRVYVEEQVCHMERRGFIDAYGDEHIRRVRVCD